MERQSNIELLRIVAMLFIVMHHFCLHVICPEVMDCSQPLNANIAASSLINAFVYVGVNCFVLISGFWGIHFTMKNISKLYLTCVFYALLTIGLTILLTDQTYSAGAIATNSILCISHSPWWYINCYIILMLLSPMLNLGLKQMNRKQLLYILALYTLIQFYLGNTMQAYLFDSNGYNILNFIYLYIISYTIHTYVPLDTIRARRWTWCAVYVVGSILWGCIACGRHIGILQGWNIMTYNHPIVVVNSVALLLFMLSFEFKSKQINWVASGVLAAYLIQDHWIEGNKSFVYELFTQYTNGFSVLGKYIMGAVCSVALVGIASVIDHVRATLFGPILNHLPSKQESTTK